MRITMACPASMIADANEMALVLGRHRDDVKTFGNAGWQDKDGNLYACASGVEDSAYLTKMQSTLKAPAHARSARMASANRAKSKVVLWNGVGRVPKAIPTALTFGVGDDGRAVLAAMGLTMVDTVLP